jgi:hypothetical protein
MILIYNTGITATPTYITIKKGPKKKKEKSAKKVTNSALRIKKSKRGPLLFLGSALWRYYSAALCKEYKFYHDFDF